MKKIGTQGHKWLKGFHIVFASLWAGGAVSLSLRQFFINPSDGRELYGILATMDFIDFFIIIPGAVGCLLTSIIYANWTNWGWFKHNWIKVKWIILLYGIIFGTFLLGPWLSEMTQIANARGLRALSDATFQYNRLMSMIFGTFQTCTIIFSCFISVLKPWRKRV